ncbi:hypothetical protein NDU88_005737 [Pleurodeles waltl]|uniref:Uncharacterized protein n=1 Tax=Pleurodeles waltl TaxID=8319 RepID=A0AAV7QFL4_PLEWA|nr:hypothetical protein NDU88_005737 [Pleurodeles waltl]
MLLLYCTPALSDRLLGLQITGPYPHQGVCDSWWLDIGQALRQAARQLLFSEALLHLRTPPSASEVHPPSQPNNMADQAQETTMDRILQEISVVVHRLEGMDNAMTSLTAEMKSKHLDIVGFQSQVTGLEQRVAHRLGPKRWDEAN